MLCGANVAKAPLIDDDEFIKSLAISVEFYLKQRIYMPSHWRANHFQACGFRGHSHSGSRLQNSYLQ